MEYTLTMRNNRNATQNEEAKMRAYVVYTNEYAQQTNLSITEVVRANGRAFAASLVKYGCNQDKGGTYRLIKSDPYPMGSDN